MLKMLKLAVLSKISVSQVYLKIFPCKFLNNRGESHVVVTVLHIFTVVCRKSFFKNCSIAGKF